MFREALTKFATEVVMGLARDLWVSLKDVDDGTQAEAKVRGVLKARLHEEVHNALVRAVR